MLKILKEKQNIFHKVASRKLIQSIGKLENEEKN